MVNQSNQISHCAINCDDVPRAKRFYEGVFGWQFAPWGPPNFFRTTDSGPVVALQGRREIVPGKRMIGAECSISVTDIDATIAAVEAAGGKIVMPKVTIPTVGQLIFFEDTEGNIAGAMQYETPAGGL
ncbi:MAG: VOC family protein [Acidobacteriota bacterium]